MAHAGGFPPLPRLQIPGSPYQQPQHPQQYANPYAYAQQQAQMLMNQGMISPYQQHQGAIGPSGLHSSAAPFVPKGAGGGGGGVRPVTGQTGFVGTPSGMAGPAGAGGYFSMSPQPLSPAQQHRPIYPGGQLGAPPMTPSASSSSIAPSSISPLQHQQLPPPAPSLSPIQSTSQSGLQQQQQQQQGIQGGGGLSGQGLQQGQQGWVVPPNRRHQPRPSLTLRSLSQHSQLQSQLAPPQPNRRGTTGNLAPPTPTGSLRPPLTSPALSSNSNSNQVSVASQQPKAKKILVRIPREWISEEKLDSAEAGLATGLASKKALWSRRPLENYEEVEPERFVKRRRREGDNGQWDEDEGEEEVDDESGFAARSRSPHPETARLGWETLPPTIDIYLPGQAAWEDFKRSGLEEKLEKLGFGRNQSEGVPSDILSLKLQNILRSQQGYSPLSSPNKTGPFSFNHQRTGSLLPLSSPSANSMFGPMGSANQRGRGHAGTMSLALPSNGAGRAFFSPGGSINPANMPLPPSPFASGYSDPSAAGNTGFLGVNQMSRNPWSMPTSPLATEANGKVSKDEESENGYIPAKKLGLQELNRVFGIEEEEEPEEEETEAEDPTREDDEVTDRDGEGEDEEEEVLRRVESDGGHSRKQSINAGLVRRSSTSDFERLPSIGGRLPNRLRQDDENSDLATNPSEEPRSATVRRGHHQSNSFGPGEAFDQQAHERRASQASYYASDEESLGDEMVSNNDEEYSNPSEEERDLEERRRRSVGGFGAPPDPDNWILGEDEDIVSNPSDEERHRKGTIGRRVPFQFPGHQANTSGDSTHRMSQNFTFPPRPLPQPPSGFTSVNTSFDARTGIGGQHARKSSLNAHAPEFVFGARPSLGAAVDPVANPQKKPTLNAFAAEFKPVFTYTAPAGAPKISIPPPQPAQPVYSSIEQPQVEEGGVKRQKVKQDIWLSGSEADTDRRKSIIEANPELRERDGKDNMRSFKFPRASQEENTPAEDFPPEASGISRQFATLGRSTLNPTARPFELIPTQPPPKAPLPDAPVYNAQVTPQKSRPGLPDFGTPPNGVVVEGTSISRSAGKVGSAERFAHPDKNLSFDDGTLPTIARTGTKAIPIQPPAGSSLAPPSASFPQSPSLHQGHDEDINFSESEASQSESESDDEEGAEEEGEQPPALKLFQMFEEILDDKLNSLRDELSGFSVLRNDLESLKRDALIDAIMVRLEPTLVSFSEKVSTLTVPSDASAPAAVAPAPIDPELLRQLFEDGQRKLSAGLVELAVTKMSEVQRSSFDEPPARESHMVDAIISGVVDQLPVWVARRPAEVTSDPEPETKGLQGPSSAELLGLAEKVDRLAPLIESLANKEKGAEAPELVSQFSDVVKGHIEGARTEPIDLDTLANRLSETVKPHIYTLIDLASDKKETAGIIAEHLRPILTRLEPVEHDLDAISSKLKDSLLPHVQHQVDIVKLRKDILDGVSEKLAEHASSLPPAAAPMDTDGLVSKFVSSLPPGQALDLSPVIQQLDPLRESLDSRDKKFVEMAENLVGKHDQVHRKLKEVQDALAAQANERDTQQFAELAQRNDDLAQELAKARGEYGLVRGEKAIAEERLESTKKLLENQMQDLKARLQQRDKDFAEMERRLHEQQTEKEGLIASRAQLEERLKNAEEIRSQQLELDGKHIKQVGDLQDKLKSVESQVAASKRSVEDQKKRADHLQQELDGHQTRSRSEADQLSKEIKALEEAARLKDNSHRSETDKLNNAKAKLEGQVAAQTKQISSLDEKVQNLQRTNGNKQQSLATSQQKVSELEKRIAELTKRNEELAGSKEEADRLRAGIQEREAEEARLRGIEDRLTSEVNDYQKRFADLEGDLESMKVVVGREMQDASDKLKTANEEKQHLAEERDRLLNLIKDMSSKDRAATPTRNNVNGVHSHIPTPYTNSNLNNFPPAPSTYGPSRPITPHYAGSSAMTARYTPSPTPSKMREVQEDDSGWWS